MKLKRGFVIEQPMIWLVICVVVIGVGFLTISKVFAGDSQFQGVNNWVETIIPWLGQDNTVAPGTALIGIDLSKEGAPFVFYTGEKWVKMNKEDFLLDGKTINTGMVRNELWGFYFVQERNGEGSYAEGFLKVDIGEMVKDYKKSGDSLRSVEN